jgi:hypothetical protein
MLSEPLPPRRRPKNALRYGIMGFWEGDDLNVALGIILRDYSGAKKESDSENETLVRAHIWFSRLYLTSEVSEILANHRVVPPFSPTSASEYIKQRRKSHLK